MRQDVVLCRMFVCAMMLSAVAVCLAGETPEWCMIEDGWKKARAERKPLLVYVSLSGCYYCRRMELQTWTDKRLGSVLTDNFVVARVDGEKDGEWLSRWGVRVFPTVLVISPDNKVLLTVAGYVTAEQLTRDLLTCQGGVIATATSRMTR